MNDAIRQTNVPELMTAWGRYCGYVVEAECAARGATDEELRTVEGPLLAAAKAHNWALGRQVGAYIERTRRELGIRSRRGPRTASSEDQLVRLPNVSIRQSAYDALMDAAGDERGAVSAVIREALRAHLGMDPGPTRAPSSELHRPSGTDSRHQAVGPEST